MILIKGKIMQCSISHAQQAFAYRNIPRFYKWIKKARV